MSDIRDILAETATRVLGAHSTREQSAEAEAGGWPRQLWTALEEAGLTQAMVADGEADLGDAMTLVRLAGYFSAPVPLAETLLATWLASSSLLDVPSGPLSVAPVLPDDVIGMRRDGGDFVVSGTANGIPWASQAQAIVVMASLDGVPHLALVPRDAVEIRQGRNIAGEPRDTIVFRDTRVESASVVPCADGAGPEELFQRGALCRASAMAGALDKVLEVTVAYAGQRAQFGRAIAKFQAVQQQIATLAGSVAAAGSAVEAAALEAGGRDGGFAIAATKARVNEAATAAAAIAHQVHGAMGFTREYELHLSTRRLWAWREEFGDESFWWNWLGRRVAAAGADGLWPLLVGGAGQQTELLRELAS
jgi:acyl-CoA dehydrogenase